MALAYVLLPLPMGLAWFRAHFEKEAYAETIRAAAEVWGPDYPARDGYRRYIISQFTGPSYGWMWPFPKAVNAGIDSELARITISSKQGSE